MVNHQVIHILALTAVFGLEMHLLLNLSNIVADNLDRSSSEPTNKYGCSYSGGVKVMNIEGRMKTERERAIGMTEAERAWRAQWLKDQHLHDEPITPDSYYRERYNPIRRFYRAPLNKLEAFLAVRLNPSKAEIIRHFIGKMSIGIVGFYFAAYYFKYHPSNWETKSGWKITQSRLAMYPGDPDFPNFKNKEPHEYAAFGFEKSPI